MIKYEVGSGRSFVRLFAEPTADGYMFILEGGEKPHFGAAVVSSFEGFQEICLNKHKDNFAAKIITDMVYQKTGKNSACLAGIHIDNASKDEIDAILNNVTELGRMFLADINFL